MIPNTDKDLEILTGKIKLFRLSNKKVKGNSSMLKSKLLSGVSIATVSLAMTMSAQAQNAIDEVVVTARKKAESLQDVPVFAAAMGEEQLDALGIDVFTDYLVQMLDRRWLWARPKYDLYSRRRLDDTKPDDCRGRGSGPQCSALSRRTAAVTAGP